MYLPTEEQHKCSTSGMNFSTSRYNECWILQHWLWTEIYTCSHRILPQIYRSWKLLPQDAYLLHTSWSILGTWYCSILGSLQVILKLLYWHKRFWCIQSSIIITVHSTRHKSHATVVGLASECHERRIGPAIFAAMLQLHPSYTQDPALFPPFSSFIQWITPISLWMIHFYCLMFPFLVAGFTLWDPPPPFVVKYTTYHDGPTVPFSMDIFLETWVVDNFCSPALTPNELTWIVHQRYLKSTQIADCSGRFSSLHLSKSLKLHMNSSFLFW